MERLIGSENGCIDTMARKTKRQGASLTGGVAEKSGRIDTDEYDDHDHFRKLTQSPGVIEVSAQQIVIHLMPRTNYGGELKRLSSRRSTASIPLRGPITQSGHLIPTWESCCPSSSTESSVTEGAPQSKRLEPLERGPSPVPCHSAFRRLRPVTERCSLPGRSDGRHPRAE